MSQPNAVQKAIGWILSKSIGFPSTFRLTDPNSPLYIGGDSYSGVSVTGLNALQLSTVWGCCRVLGNVHSSFPVDVVKKTGSGREILDNHWISDLLQGSPNPNMTSLEFFEAMGLSFDLWGNAYAEIVWIGKRATALWPLHPDRMQVQIKDSEILYQYSDSAGKTNTIPQNNVLHIKNFSIDGVNGLSPIAMSRETVGHAFAAQRYGASFFRNSGRPGGAIQFPAGGGPTKPEAQKRLREELDAFHKGAENAGKTMMLYDGATWQAVTIPPEDAQYIDTRKLSKAEIAEIYGVPLNLLAQSDKTATFASAEQFDQQFVKYTMAPRCARFERAFKKALLSKEQGIHVCFNMDSLLRGDSASRVQYLSQMVQNGLMTRNEARAKENLNPIEGGDELTVQSNLIDLDKLASVVAAATPTSAPSPGGAD